jgi:hypothetical protein
MKRLLLIFVMAGLLTGCAGMKGAGADSDFSDNLSPGRGTTSVSSGAELGTGITGSDVFAPR